jgi:hypothetical protein
MRKVYTVGMDIVRSIILRMGGVFWGKGMPSITVVTPHQRKGDKPRTMKFIDISIPKYFNERGFIPAPSVNKKVSLPWDIGRTFYIGLVNPFFYNNAIRVYILL